MKVDFASVRANKPKVPDNSAPICRRPFAQCGNSVDYHEWREVHKLDLPVSGKPLKPDSNRY